MITALLAPLAALALAADAPKALDAKDVHSYAEPAKAVVRHADLDLAISFAERTVSGTTTLTVERRDPVAPVTLDTQDLEIKSVSASADGKTFAPAAWELGKADPILGSPLTISLPKGATLVRIEHRSKPGAAGLQWLTPEQTAGKKYPYLFTQSQAIHARSWLPLQDSPGVRVTYAARVRAPWPLGVVMSAAGNAGESVAPPERGPLDEKRPREFRFAMDKAIPPYLISLAVGELGFRPLGPRTGVYTEPSVLDKAAAEFSDIESMLATVEGLYGPYRWGRYDFLVLPPSFAFGGMENPMLTFVSPTTIAGDKSLVGVLAHELSHSWSGNLVTNATARDFWLNEGFTTYVERRIVEKVYGRERATMEYVLGREDLEKDFSELPPGDRVLHVDLTGRDPDDGVTSVPYERGALFLRALEDAAGRERFDRFLRGWFDAHAFQSVTTAEFRRYLDAELLSKDPKIAQAVPVERWIEAAPLPENAPRAESKAFADAEARAKAWVAGALDDAGLAAAAKAWGYHERHHFLRSLPKDLDAAKLARLDKIFGLTETGNAELACEWLQMSIRADYKPAMPRLEAFLTSVGRGKLVRPLYKELAKTPAGRERASKVYARAKPIYQAPVAAAVEKILAGKS